jgi:hypothetical protein
MNATNPYEYNTDSIPEKNWFYTVTIVIKQPASEFGFRKLKNKEVVKWLYKIFKDKIPTELITIYREWFATCSSEIQKESELLHFHLILGSLFNKQITDDRPDLVNGNRKQISEKIEKWILETPFLDGDVPYCSVKVKPYKFKSECIRKDGTLASWIGYKFKKEQNPYWSDYYQRMVTLKNATDADDGVIPKTLLDLGFNFTPERKQLHNDAVDSGYGDTTEE